MSANNQHALQERGEKLAGCLFLNTLSHTLACVRAHKMVRVPFFFFFILTLASQPPEPPTPSPLRHSHTHTLTQSTWKYHTHITTCTVTSQEWTQANRQSGSEAEEEGGEMGRDSGSFCRLFKKKKNPIMGAVKGREEFKANPIRGPKISCSQPIKNQETPSSWQPETLTNMTTLSRVNEKQNKKQQDCHWSYCEVHDC